MSGCSAFTLTMEKTILNQLVHHSLPWPALLCEANYSIHTKTGSKSATPQVWSVTLIIDAMQSAEIEPAPEFASPYVERSFTGSGTADSVAQNGAKQSPKRRGIA